MEKKLVTKISVSVLVVLIGTLAYTGIMNTVFIDKTFINVIDRNANEYLDDTMKKALVTFAIVRGLNAVISVVQDSDVAVSPAGVGMSIAVGQVLDPVNDLIERFSWVMLASSTSLGIQKILMNIGIWLGFKVLLCVSMLTILMGLWFPHLFEFRIRFLGYKLLLVSVIVRFCIPVVALATSSIDTLFLKAKYEEAALTLEKASHEIKEDGSLRQDLPTDENIIQKIKNFFKGIGQAIHFEEKIQQLKDTISSYTEYIIDLIVVFILQTIVLPLIVLYLLIRLFNKVLGINIIEKIKPTLKKHFLKEKPGLATTL